MLARDITVSATAITQARHAGLTGDVEARVRGFAAASVPSTHQIGNRAYGPFVMLMRGPHVVAFSFIGPRVIDERAPHECKICQGLMVKTVKSGLNGKEGTAARPCPRAFNPDAPLCDTLVKRIP